MKNQPYNVLRHVRQWERAPRMPGAVGAGIAGFLAATTGVVISGAVAYYAIGYIAITAVTSWALRALTPKPPELSSFGGETTSRSILVNQKDPISPHDFVYGQVRKGGIVTYYGTSGGDNKYLHQIVVLAGHEVEEIGDIYINDEVVELDEDNFVISEPYNSKIRINKHLGAADQLADADLVSEIPAIDENFRGRGLAYMYIRYEYDQDSFPSGLPLVTAVVKGKKVYDPRTATTAYSTNAALCIRDFITSAYGLNDNQVDDVSFAAAANICDEDVQLANGGTEKKYTMNGVSRADISYGDVLGDMVTSCAGTLFWGAGKWKLTVGDYVAPTKVLTSDDLRGPINLMTRVSLRDQFNTVKGTFNNSDERWIVGDYQQVTDAVFVAEDGGQETALELPLPFTTSFASAERIAKLTLYRGREQMSFTANFGLNAFDVEVGEIIALTNDRYGWVEKEFEVTGWSFGPDSNGALAVSLTLRETSESAFDWNAEETALVNNNTTLPDPFEAPVPVLGTPVTSAQMNNDGTIIPELRFSWTVTTPTIVDYYKFQWRISGETDWNSISTTEPRFVLSPAISGNQYEYRVASVNQLGVSSAYAEGASALSVPNDGSIPNPPDELEAFAGYKYIGLVWDAPTQNTDTSIIKDLFGYKIYRNTENNFSTATFIARTGATAYTDTGLADEATLYYWVTAVDFSGNESSQSAPASTTTLIAPEGTRGAGRWNVSVVALPTTSAEANTAFVADVGTPVDRDQAWFYTGNQSAPTAQNVWIYNAGTTTWVEQTEVIDGSLLVAGTITADRLEAQSLSGLGLTIGSLSDNPTGERIVIQDSKIEVYDDTNTLRVILGDLT